ncbi:MAG TPA: hypothetical protein VFV38_01740 [Ktedonobacteraceae bacterium]|nr:hypothetical protein [Ktedonobacteraceae bacterium]
MITAFQTKLALVDERGLFPDSLHMLHLDQRVLVGPKMRRTEGRSV